MASSNKGLLLSKVVFHQKLSFIKGSLPHMVVFLQGIVQVQNSIPVFSLLLVDVSGALVVVLVVKGKAKSIPSLYLPLDFDKNATF